MRVQTFHRHIINRSCPLLGAVLMVNMGYSLCFAAPVMFAYLVMRRDIGLTSAQWTWYVCIVVAWTVVEQLRLYLGRAGNVLQQVPSLLIFTTLTLVPQLPIMVLYNMFVPQRNSLDFAVSISLIVFIVVEFTLSIRILYTLMSNNRIDYFVYGARTMM